MRDGTQISHRNRAYRKRAPLYFLQAGFSDKYAQQEPPSGEDSSSTCDPAVRATACGGSTGAKRLREPALDASSLDLDKPLTPLQLATYLAGFAHAMGLNFDAAAALLQWQQLPPQPLQPHIGASVPFAAQPAGPFDVIKCQQSLLQTAEARCWLSLWLVRCMLAHTHACGAPWQSTPHLSKNCPAQSRLGCTHAAADCEPLAPLPDCRKVTLQHAHSV